MKLSPISTITPAAMCAIKLNAIRRRIELLELAMQNPIAWLCFNLAAIALELEAPAEELARLWLAESLLEAALAWYES